MNADPGIGALFSGGLMGIFLWVLIGFVSLITIGSLIFWIWMLIDAARNPHLSSDQRIVWILVIVLAGWIGAIIYFFVARVARPKYP